MFLLVLFCSEKENVKQLRYILELSCCKKWQKNVQGKKLVWELGKFEGSE
jgi:hypothetical protein